MSTGELIPQSIQTQAQVPFASLGWCHMWAKFMKWCARISAVGAVEVPVFVCLRSSPIRVTGIGGP